MANNFSTLKLENELEKFTLIRINPAKYITSDLILDSGTTYQMTFPFSPVNRITVDGTDYTLTTGTPSSTEFTFDETTKEIKINFGVALTTQTVVAFYYMFFTAGRNRVINETPDNTSTTLRDWEPKVESEPSFSASIENALDGIVSISSSSVTIVSDNYDFHAHLGDDYSFYNKDIAVWLCLNTTEHIKKTFDGKITDIKVVDNKVTINFRDVFGLMKQTATFNDTDIYYTIDSFANLNPNSENKPIPYIVGNVSQYKTASNGTLLESTFYERDLVFDSLLEAVNTNYDENVTTSVNREWSCCRVHTDGFLDFTQTISAVDNVPAGYTRLTVPDSTEYRIGDTFTVAAGPDVYVRVLNIDTANDYLYVTKDATIVSSDVIEGNDCPTIVIRDTQNNTSYYPLYERDYTATVTATDGGNKFLKITFTNNFEANLSMPTLDPSSFTVYFRVRPDQTTGTHAKQLKYLLGKLNITVNDASFTQADTDLVANTNYSVPFFDSSSTPTYLDIIEKLLKSTFGYLTLNNSFEVEYHIVNTPTGTETIDDDSIENNSFSTSIEYRDLAYKLIAENPHYNDEELTRDSNNTPTLNKSKNKTRYLHETEETIVFEHILEKFNDAGDRIMNYRGDRKAKYLFNTFTRNLENIVGDEITVERNGLIGNGSSRDLIILSLKKSTQKVEILTTDLLGV